LGETPLKKLLAVLVAATVASVGCVQAQAWPSRNVRIIVPFAPGSTPDSVGRIIADAFQTKFGTPFVVENKPGASGNTGTDAIAKAEADGTTIGLSIVGPLALNKLLFQSLPYDPARDLVPITIVASQPSILVVSNELGIKSFAEFTTLLKRDSAKLNFGSIGYGSLSQLSMVAIAMKSNAHPEHIPYAGSPNRATSRAADAPRKRHRRRRSRCLDRSRRDGQYTVRSAGQTQEHGRRDHDRCRGSAEAGGLVYGAGGEFCRFISCGAQAGAGPLGAGHPGQQHSHR
jgi:hypothetical protein